LVPAAGNARRRDAARALVLASAACIGLCSCTPTARTPGPYASKAASAAEAVHSAVASDLVLLVAVERGHTTAAFTSVAASDAEDDASSAASTFLSIQPPDHRSDKLRAELSDLLDDAQSALGDARVAARRHDRVGLLGTRDDLRAVARRLDAFQRAHG